MIKKAVIIISLTALFSFIPLQIVHAAFWDSFIDDVKKLLLSPAQPAVLSIESSITLAPGGDIDKDNEIDAGDTITFTYNIQNNTDKKYTYATLKTNIQRDSLNFIHNVSGVTGLKDDGKTIEFPNLRVEPGTVNVISFDARVNYFTEQDPIITTEPELITEDKKSLLKSDKKQIQVKRVRREDIPNQIQIFKKDK